MTTRERWTVYPLLFLAILIAARSQLFPSERTKFRTLECQELVVTNVNGESLVHVGESTNQAGIIVVYGPLAGETISDAEDGNPANGKAETRQTATHTVKSPVAELGSETAGGVLRLRSRPGIPTVYLGHHPSEQLSGLMAEERADRLISSEKRFGGQYWGSQFTWSDFVEMAAEDQSPEANTASDSIQTDATQHP